MTEERPADAPLQQKTDALQSALKAMQIHRWHKAVGILDAVLEQEPEHREATYYRAVCAREIAKVTPDHARYFKAEALRKMGTLNAAQAILHRLTHQEIDIPRQPIYLSLARIYYAQDDPAQAQAYVDYAEMAREALVFQQQREEAAENVTSSEGFNPNLMPRFRALETIARRMAETSREDAVQGLATDRHTWPDETEPLDVPLLAAAFRGDDGQARLEIHYALPTGTITREIKTRAGVHLEAAGRRAAAPGLVGSPGRGGVDASDGTRRNRSLAGRVGGDRCGCRRAGTLRADRACHGRKHRRDGGTLAPG